MTWKEKFTAMKALGFGVEVRGQLTEDFTVQWLCKCGEIAGHGGRQACVAFAENPEDAVNGSLEYTCLASSRIEADKKYIWDTWSRFIDWLQIKVEEKSVEDQDNDHH